MCLAAYRVCSSRTTTKTGKFDKSRPVLVTESIETLLLKIEFILQSKDKKILDALYRSFRLSKNSTEALNESATHFLRQAYLLVRCFSSSSEEDKEKITTLSQLCKYFGVSLPENVFLDSYTAIKYSPLFSRWSDHSSVLMLAPVMRSFQLRKFIDLPETYSPLYLKFCQGMKCKNCNQVPNRPTICLVCGEFLCFAQSCCGVDGQGEVSRHSDVCCPGGGAFLLLKECIVILTLGKDRRCVWGSLYLDEHGEEDRNLRRGRTLYLSKARLSVLERIVFLGLGLHDSRILRMTRRENGYGF